MTGIRISNPPAIKLGWRGADNYLLKPIPVDAILHVLDDNSGTPKPEPDAEATMTPLSRLEREHIQQALNDTNGNISAAAHAGEAPGPRAPSSGIVGECSQFHPPGHRSWRGMQTAACSQTSGAEFRGLMPSSSSAGAEGVRALKPHATICRTPASICGRVLERCDGTDANLGPIQLG
jgi:hypothetical protein